MQGYFEYISAMLGGTILMVIVFMIAVIGPLLLFNLLKNERPQCLQAFKWPLAALTFFTNLILFIGSGGYIGSLFDVAALGMGGGLVSFYYAYNAFTALLPSTCPVNQK